MSGPDGSLGASQGGSFASLRDRLVAAVGDRYVIESEVGRGGMAVVYAATDARLKRAVAIKALPPDLAFRADVKSRFLREAQLAAGLSHPHIVPIYAVEEHDGLVYMVMGFVRGESLAQRLHRARRLPAAEARRILRETADALAHAHAQGVIHRDIKPDNILLEDGSGRVLVTDFGIARAMEGDARLTATGIAVGTPTYMSPEQARGDDDVDGRSDLYALGVVGYQMLAGEPPFQAPNTPALLLKHVSEPPPPVSSRRGDVPPALAYAVDRALAKERSERWRDAAAMRTALADDAALPPPPHAHAAQRPVPPRASAAAPPHAPPHAPPPAHAPASARDPYPALPPYPVWRGGGEHEHARWKEAQRAWREQVRAQADEWREGVRGRSDDRRDGHRGRRELAREERTARSEARSGPRLSQRIKGFQWHVVSNLLVMGFLFFVNAASGGFPWFIFPWAGMLLGIGIHALALWQNGAKVRDFFTSPARLDERDGTTDRRVPAGDASGKLRSRGGAAGAARSGGALPSADPDARARELVGDAVLRGPHGVTVRRATDDERAAREVFSALAQADREQLPDVEPTLRSLVERIASLAQALHRLAEDAHPSQLERIDARLAEARALPAETRDRDRRVTLLERQRTSVMELMERQTVLESQLDHAALVLQTMRLDLVRLRSAGIGSAAADVHGVTQEARALSTEIGRVLEAAAEARAIG